MADDSRPGPVTRSMGGKYSKSGTEVGQEEAHFSGAFDKEIWEPFAP